MIYPYPYRSQRSAYNLRAGLSVFSHTSGLTWVRKISWSKSLALEWFLFFFPTLVVVIRHYAHLQTHQGFTFGRWSCMRIEYVIVILYYLVSSGTSALKIPSYWMAWIAFNTADDSPVTAFWISFPSFLGMIPRSCFFYTRGLTRLIYSTHRYDRGDNTVISLRSELRTALDFFEDVSSFQWVPYGEEATTLVDQQINCSKNLETGPGS